MFKKILNLKNIALLSLSMPFASFAQSIIANGGYTVTGVYTPAPPILDGVIEDDYCWTEPVILGVTNTNLYNSSTGSFPNQLLKKVNFNDGGVSSGSPVAAPDDAAYAGQEASFGFAWDESYLYICAKVKSSNLSSIAQGTAINGEAVEVFINNGNGVSSAVPGQQTFPRLYNGTKDAQVVFNYKTQLAIGESKILLPGEIDGNGMSFPFLSTNSATNKVAVKRTGDGYVFESRFSWKDVNVEFINNITGGYTDISKAPVNPTVTTTGAPYGITRTAPFRFDIGNNISTNGKPATGRAAQLMWNQCCWNINWSASLHFGHMVLAGVKNVIPVESVTITVPGGGPFEISTPYSKFQLKANILQRGANPLVDWSLAGDINGDPIALISENGLITPLNNGVITVTAVSQGNSSISDSKIITITNQVAPTVINLTGTGITTNFGSTIITSSVEPIGAPQDVIYSLASGDESKATINPVTGELRSKAAEINSSVTVIATSKANRNMTGSLTVSLNNQSPITCYTINAYTNINQCSKTLQAMTIAGYAANTRIPLVFEYVDRNITTLPGTIPNDLVSVTGKFVPAGTARLNKTSSGYELEMLLLSGFATLTGYYLNNPALPPVVLMCRALGSNPYTCSGTAFSVFNNPPFGCGSITGIESQDVLNADVSLFPNPASESVTISADGLVSVAIYSLVGSQVATASSNGKEVKISTSGLGAGIYIVSAKLKNGQVKSQKLIIEK